MSKRRRPVYEQNIDSVADRMLARHGLEADRIADNRASRADMNGNVPAAVFYENLVGVIQRKRSERSLRAAEAATSPTARPERKVGTPVLCNGGYRGTITRVCEWSDALVEVRLERGTVCVDICDCTAVEGK